MNQAYLSQYHRYQRQKEADVVSATPVKLVSILLEGAILFNKKAITAIEANRRVNAMEYGDRAVKIIMHLYNSLDFDKGGEVAVRLATLYSYAIDQYVVYMKNPTQGPLEAVNSVLAAVLDGWKQLEGKWHGVQPAQTGLRTPQVP